MSNEINNIGAQTIEAGAVVVIEYTSGKEKPCDKAFALLLAPITSNTASANTLELLYGMDAATMELLPTISIHEVGYKMQEATKEERAEYFANLLTYFKGTRNTGKEVQP